MSPNVRSAFYVLTAATFLWLTWRCVWAMAPSAMPKTMRAQKEHPVLIWINMAFYAGMASFEMSVNMGL